MGTIHRLILFLYSANYTLYYLNYTLTLMKYLEYLGKTKTNFVYFYKLFFTNKAIAGCP